MPMPPLWNKGGLRQSNSHADGKDTPTTLQAIADGWPQVLDDLAAREEWGWRPEYSLDAMTDVMLAEVAKRV